MITIIIIFCAIGFLEWKYLKRKKRSTQTFGIVLVYVSFMMIVLVSIYLLKNTWTIFNVVKAVFYPLQKLIFLEV